MHIHAGIVQRSQLQETMDVIPIEVHIVRLGDVVFATNPYELFLDYGYLPTEKAEQGSHYSAYVSSGTSGHEGGEILVRKTVQQINEMMLRRNIPCVYYGKHECIVEEKNNV